MSGFDSGSKSRKVDDTRVVRAILDNTRTSVRAVIGTVEMTAAQLLGLRPGAIVPFSDTIHRRVRLYLDDVLIGQAELVDVDGRRGIHVLALDSER